jgi:predicted membrane protein
MISACVTAAFTLVIWIAVMAVVMKKDDFWIWFWIVISILGCLLIGIQFSLWLKGSE